MSVDLADYVESLKREVTPIGADPFAGINDSVWVGYLSDAFWEARLDGFVVGYTADTDGLITPEVTGDPDLNRRYVALIVLYAGIKVLRNKILNMNTSFRAKAGPVEFEQQNSATMLVEMLKQLRATKDRILEELDDAEVSGVVELDAFSIRMFNSGSYWGSPELMG